MILVVQIVSGILLAMFYCPNEKFAFFSVAELSWDISNGHFSGIFMLMGRLYFFVCLFAYGERSLLWWV